jgi:hypothetical protein
VRTLYLVDRVALGERRLPCRKGLVFVGGTNGQPWHAVICCADAPAFTACSRERALPFGACTTDGLWLEGIVALGREDNHAHAHYLEGVGPLQVTGETATSLPDSVSWTTRYRGEAGR